MVKARRRVVQAQEAPRQCVHWLIVKASAYIKFETDALGVLAAREQIRCPRQLDTASVECPVSTHFILTTPSIVINNIRYRELHRNTVVLC
jgi:hypothetical protein